MTDGAMRDVSADPAPCLYLTGEGIHIPVTYRACWNDGFGPRGWKLDATLGDPRIIASTRDTASRTRADPTPDYRQMVEEDLLAGRVLGEGLRSFLPAELLSHAAEDGDLSNAEAMGRLRHRIGAQALTGRPVDRFFELGGSGTQHALESRKKLTLDPTKRRELGLALQSALDACDTEVEASGAELVEAVVTIGADRCALTLGRGHPPACRPAFQAEIG